MQITVQRTVHALGMFVPGSSVLDCPTPHVEDTIAERMADGWRCVASVAVPMGDSGHVEAVLWWARETP